MNATVAAVVERLEAALNRATRSRSPQRSGGRRSPHRSERGRSPQRNERGRSPQRNERGRSPQRSERGRQRHSPGDSHSRPRSHDLYRGDCQKQPPAFPFGGAPFEQPQLLQLRGKEAEVKASIKKYKVNQ